jgi:hypothetical protein
MGKRIKEVVLESNEFSVGREYLLKIYIESVQSNRLIGKVIKIKRLS